MSKQISQDYKNGHLDALLTVAMEMPQQMIYKEVKKMLKKPMTEVKKYMEKVAKKPENKLTMEEAMIVTEIKKIFDKSQESN